MTIFPVGCPLGGHEASFDCETLTLDCRECVYALSAEAAASLFRLADHVETLQALVDEQLATTEPARRLAAVLEAEAA